MLQPIWSMKSLAVGRPPCPCPTQSAQPPPTTLVRRLPLPTQTLPAFARVNRMSGGETSWRRASCIPSNSAMPNVDVPLLVIGPPGRPNPTLLVPARPANRLCWLLRRAETSSTLCQNLQSDTPLMSKHSMRKFLTAALPHHQPFQHTQEQDNTTRNRNNTNTSTNSNSNKREPSAGKRTAHTRWSTTHR